MPPAQLKYLPELHLRIHMSCRIVRRAEEDAHGLLVYLPFELRNLRKLEAVLHPACDRNEIDHRDIRECRNIRIEWLGDYEFIIRVAECHQRELDRLASTCCDEYVVLIKTFDPEIPVV